MWERLAVVCRREWSGGFGGLFIFFSSFVPFLFSSFRNCCGEYLVTEQGPYPGQEGHLLVTLLRKPGMEVRGDPVKKNHFFFFFLRIFIFEKFTQ